MEQEQSFGKKLRKLRRDRDYSQREFAELLGIKQPTISAYETDTAEPTLSKLVAIARECNVSLDWLCGLHETMDLVATTEQVASFYQYLSSTDFALDMQKYITKNR